MSYLPTHTGRHEFPKAEQGRARPRDKTEETADKTEETTSIKFGRENVGVLHDHTPEGF